MHFFLLNKRYIYADFHRTNYYRRLMLEHFVIEVSIVTVYHYIVLNNWWCVNDRLIGHRKILAVFRGLEKNMQNKIMLYTLFIFCRTNNTNKVSAHIFKPQE